MKFRMEDPKNVGTDGSPKTKDMMAAWAEEAVSSLQPTDETTEPEHLEVFEEEPEIRVGDTFIVKENIEFKILERSVPRFMVSITDKSGHVNEYIADELEIEDAINGLLDFSKWELIRDTHESTKQTNIPYQHETTGAVKQKAVRHKVGDAFTLNDGTRLRIEEREIPRFMVSVTQGSRAPKEYLADELEIEDAKNGLLDFSKWELIPNMTEVNEFDPGTAVFYGGSVCNIEEIDAMGRLNLFNPATGEHYEKIEKKLVTVIIDPNTKKPQKAEEIWEHKKLV